MNDQQPPVFRGRSMICFGHDWTGDPLSKTHLMRLLSKENKILWINSIGYRTPTASARDFKRIVNKLKAFSEPVKEVEPNIFVLSPLAIPAYGLPFVKEVNRELLKLQIKRAMRRLGFSRTINWVFNPTGSVVAGSLGEESIVYYCVDDFTAFHDAGTGAMVEMEKRLLRKADLVVVSAARLLKSKSPENPNTVLIRHGVDYDHFRKTLLPETVIPAEIKDLPKPVLGYFGLMAKDWIDVPLLEKLARKYAHGSLVLIGHVNMDMGALPTMPNVHLIGRKKFSELPGYSKGFDVALNVFPINEVTKSANPLKVREYLAAGLPVVSPRIPEVEVLGDQVFVADDHDDFLSKVEEALKNPGPNDQRSLAMQDESWAGRVRELARQFARVARI